MPSSALRTSSSSGFLTGLLAERVRRELGAVFGKEFTFWDDRQRLLRRANSDARSEIQKQTTALSLRHSGPQVLQIVSHQRMLAVPITQNGAVAAVAVSLFPNSASPRQLIQTAHLVLDKIQAHDDIEYLRQQNEEHLIQATQDLEELTFLRSFVKHLEVTNTSDRRWSIAEKILPSLLHSTCSEELLLVGSSSVSGRDVPSTVLRRFGTDVVSEACGLELVKSFQPRADRETIVQNGLGPREGMPEGGIRNVIIVPLTKVRNELAWLVAINRRIVSPETIDVRWALSQHEFGTSEASLVESAASILSTHEQNVELLRDKERLIASVVRVLVSTIEAKDQYTRGHSERVALFAECLARTLDLPPKHCERLYLTGLVHDVGKIGVSDAILKKPTALTDEEFEEVKKHPDDGWAILRELQQLAYVLPGVLYHHERFDGRGYPDGLLGEDIPLDGRILAVADAYDAMTSDRAYRDGRPQQEAEAVLRDGAGTQWDPRVIDAFFAARDTIVGLREGYRAPPKPQRIPSTMFALDEQPSETVESETSELNSSEVELAGASVS